MLRPSHLKMLLLLSPALVAGCGGGTAGTTDTNGTTTTTVSGQTTTTASGPTTSTTPDQTTTTAPGQTTTTASTPTTTASTSTTTNDGSLPPLATTKTVLVKGTSGQVLGTPTWPDAYNSSTGAPVGNANCDYWDRPRDYFSHAHLSIFKNGERLAIPQYIGWRSECIYDLNSDNRNGVVDQVSSTGYKFMTLGQLFTIWGQPLSWTNVAGITGLPIVIYVEDNGKLFQYTGDPANIEIGNYRSVTIQIGSRLNEIPIYDWSSYTGGGA